MSVGGKIENHFLVKGPPWHSAVPSRVRSDPIVRTSDADADADADLYTASVENKNKFIRK